MGPQPLAPCIATLDPTIRHSITPCGASSSARWRYSCLAATGTSNSRLWSDANMKPEPTLKRIDASEMPEDIASAWEASMALRGDATFFEVFANHPDLYRWYVKSFYGEIFRGGTVAQPYKELLRLRLSTLHGCRFCIRAIVGMHWRRGSLESKLTLLMTPRMARSPMPRRRCSHWESS